MFIPFLIGKFWDIKAPNFEISNNLDFCVGCLGRRQNGRIPVI